MRMNEVEYTDAQPIDGYGEGYFRIGGVAHEAPLTVTPAGVAPWGGLDDATALVSGAETLDVFLIGMGTDIAHIPQSLRDALENAGVGVEVMSSPQACRTYNVLLGEGRRIGLALLPV